MTASIPLTRIAFIDPILSYSVADLREALDSRVHRSWQECVEVYSAEAWRTVARSLDTDEETSDERLLSIRLVKFVEAQTVSWVLRALVERGGLDVNLHFPHELRRAPLHVAVQESCGAVVAYLLSWPLCDRDRRNGAGQTALHIAMYDDHVEVARLLIAAGLDAEAEDSDGTTCLHQAALQGSVRCLEALVAAGARVNTSRYVDDCTKCTPLVAACFRGHTACAVALIAAGADVNFRSATYGATPLTVACCHGNASCVHALLAAGARVDDADNDGWTPLFHACVDKHLACVQALLASGASADVADRHGSTALHSAAYSGCPDCLKALLEAGASVDTVDARLYTPLMAACETGHHDSAELLLDAGAQIDAVEEYGYSSLMLSTQRGHSSCVKLLLDEGARTEVRSTTDLRTALHLAGISGDASCVAALLAAPNIDKDAVDKDDLTALWLAVAHNKIECARLLVLAGGSPHSKARYGCMRDFAVGKGYREITELLRQDNDDVVDTGE